MTRRIRLVVMLAFVGAIQLLVGCKHDAPKYGTELQLSLPGVQRQAWAIAPTIDLSGEHVDPLLQSDIVFSQMQQVRGLTVIPVNRVVEVFTSLKIDQMQSEEQAAVVCELLGCDALVVPTVTIYDPYNPPKFGAGLQLFQKMTYAPPGGDRSARIGQRGHAGALHASRCQPTGNFMQAVGMFDAQNGSTREAWLMYTEGRHDPDGPHGIQGISGQHGSLLRVCLQPADSGFDESVEVKSTKEGVISCRTKTQEHPLQGVRDARHKDPEPRQRRSALLLPVRGRQEAKVLDALVEMVNRRDTSFDWFDAAVLSHQLGEHLAKELKGIFAEESCVRIIGFSQGSRTT